MLRTLFNNCKHLSISPTKDASSISQYLRAKAPYGQSCAGIHCTRFDSQMRNEADDTRPIKSLDFRIKSYRDSRDLFNRSNIDQSSVELNDLELHGLSDYPIVLNLTWLRDSCHCPHCTHQYSRQRLFTVKDFRREIFSVSDVQLLSDGSQHEGLHKNLGKEYSASGFLNVRWSDGHESIYSLDWLNYINGLYNKSQLRLDQAKERVILKYPEDGFYSPSKGMDVRPDTWCVSEINTKLKPVDYQDLVDGFEYNDDPTFINANNTANMSKKRFEAMWSLTDQLAKLGLAKILNVPRERNQVLNLARSLAYEKPTGYGVVFDVVVEPSEEINLAYSSLEFDLHSDLNYRETSPGVQMLHCITNSIEGGLSYFSDSFHAANMLRSSDPVLFEVLVQFPITFAVRDPYRNVIFRIQRPVITLDHQANICEVYYSPFTLPPVGFRDDIKLFYLAMDKFTKLLQSKDNKLIAKMEPGDLFVFQNRRVLHGRSAYDASASRRFLQGCYMDWDEIRCLREKLLSYKCLQEIK